MSKYQKRLIPYLDHDFGFSPQYSYFSHDVATELKRSDSETMIVSSRSSYQLNPGPGVSDELTLDIGEVAI